MSDNQNKNQLLDKAKHLGKSLHHHLGTPGWISMVTLIIVLIALGVLSSQRNECQRGERGRRFSQERILKDTMKQRKSFIDEIHSIQDQVDREIQDTQERMNEEMKLFQNSKVESIFSMNDKDQYNVQVKDGQVKGFFTSADSSGLQNVIKQLTTLGLQVEQKDTTISFSGKIEDADQILQIVQ